MMDSEFKNSIYDFFLLYLYMFHLFLESQDSIFKTIKIYLIFAFILKTIFEEKFAF